MKKIIGPIVGVGALAAAGLSGYLLFLKPAETETTPSSSASSETNEPAQSSAAGSETAGATLKDGTYTGPVVNTNRGDYQVQLTVASGKMSAIDVVVFPQDNPTSQEINGTNLPTYVSQALEKQSAEVDKITGASEAFKGFTGSLQDAINQAQ